MGRGSAAAGGQTPLVGDSVRSFLGWWGPLILMLAALVLLVLVAGRGG